MINLEEHIKVINGVEYIPAEIVRELLNKSVVPQKDFLESQLKFDKAISQISVAVQNISKDINDILKDD
jgi:hypothetical protein